MIQKTLKKRFGLLTRLREKFAPSKEIANQMMIPE